ncbi:MAG: protein translocase subunit SecF, partial [Humidesulfovibrio sp.]|nr:protein translocase subunit SecF [Humidesulfovibrio sp.]
MSFSFIKHEPNIDFIGLRYYAFLFSALMIVIGGISLVMKGGPRYGIDFAGGVIIQAKFNAPTELDTVKKVLEGTNLPGLVVQQMGQVKDNDFLIRTSTTDDSSE